MKTPFKKHSPPAIFAKKSKKVSFSYSSFADVIEFVLNI